MRKQTARRPNILLVVADQWRGMDQGWAGNPEVHTPNLDRLAAGGVAIRHAYANTPVCGPSRASLFTGQLPDAHHVVANDLPLRPDLPTMAEILAEHGYQTGLIGKWHLDGLPRDSWVPPQRRRGFDYWASSNCTHVYFDGHYYTGDSPEPVTFIGYEPEAQTELAVDFIRQHQDQPYFLVVSYNPPHDPYDDVPERYLERYDPNKLTPRANGPDDGAQRDLLCKYYAGITAVDDQLGRLLDTVDECGATGDTLVVVTADHGDMLNSHGRRAKQVPYEEAISVPLVLSWPSVLRPNTAVSGAMGLVDLPTTVLGLVGVDALPSAYGQDLSGALRDGGKLRDRVLLSNLVSFDQGYLQGVPDWVGFRDRRFTYARRGDGTSWLLYDNDADPWQATNLVVDPGRQADVRWAEEQLDELLRQVPSAPDPPSYGLDLVRRLDLNELWNAREQALHGDRGRFLPGQPVVTQ